MRQACRGGKKGKMKNAVERIGEFNRFGSVLGLERMDILLGILGDPHKELKVIHVAGTNGKGSVCKFLEKGLASCGYRTGLYTSPFIEKFNERICFDGQCISDADLEKYTDIVISAAEKMVSDGHDSPTEFEVVTAIALMYFSDVKADIVILEVGLGGRGDSTNVIKEPLACAICSISYDHTDRLGNTLEEIAAEKAGIIKPGVPVISNVKDHGAAKVIARTAYEKGCRLYDISGIRPGISEATPFSQTVTMELYGTDYSDIRVSMAGKHQAENLKTALAVIEVLRKAGKIRVERSRLYKGLKEAVQPGRFEVLIKGGEDGGSPAVIIDGAHNEAGAIALRDTMKEFFGGSRILLVTGMLADKQTDRIIAALKDITGSIIATEPDNPRKLPAYQLAEMLRDLGLDPVVASDAEESIRQAEMIWDQYDVVLFAGSLYLIGDIRRMLKDGKHIAVL